MQLPRAPDFDIVPKEILEPPSTTDCREIWHRECAELLDGYLRRLARQESLARRVLGKLASELLRRRAYNRLGFVRLCDYTRERLGLAAREVQTLARVSRRLDELPVTAAAFDAGEINWTKLRLLVSIATPATEEIWIHGARRLSSTELAEEAKEYLPRYADPAAEQRRPDQANTIEAGSENGVITDPPPSGPKPLASELTDAVDDGQLVDGEPRMLFRVRCPRRVLSLWRRVRKLACWVAGSELVLWQAAEAIAAEGISGATGIGRSKATDTASPKQTSWNRDATEHERPSRRSEAELAELLGISGLRETIDWTAIEEAIPSTLEDLSAGVPDIAPHDLDARMRTTLAAMQRIDWQIGRLLHTLFRMRLYRELGFATSAAYITDRLGMSVRKARGLVAIERKSCRCGFELGDAYRAGKLSWLRTLALLPIVTESNASAWIERACEVTLRRLTDEVEWARGVFDCDPRGRPVAPPELGATLDPDQVQSGASLTGRASDGAGERNDELVDAEVSFRGPASIVALLDDAMASFSEAHEAPWRGLERLLLHAMNEWENLPRHRDPVHQRDGWRCRVPACSSRKTLQDHHIVFRSHRRDNSRSNRISVCVWHHLHGIHGGLIRARGYADRAVVWELGLRPGTAPLMTLEGDAYVSDTADAQAA